MKRIILLGLGFLLVFVAASAQAQGGPTFIGTVRVHGQIGINEKSPEAPLHVVSEFYEGGPTVVIENANDPGSADIAIDFQAAGDLFANMGLSELYEGGNGRFFILQNNPHSLNLTLVESGDGNVGIGTSQPGTTLHVVRNSGEGSIINVENADQNGDVPIDFLLGGLGVVGNVGVVRQTMDKPQRFVVLEVNNYSLPLTLAENGGYVGIGLSNPIHLLHLGGGAHSNGTEWLTSSSREYKDNIQAITNEEAIDTLKELNPVKFAYKTDPTEKHVGFISEEVPDLIATKDRKGLSPMDIVAVLTKVVQEQQRMMQEQQKTISTLREELNDLKGKMR